MSDQRVYRIQSHPLSYWTGHRTNGEQVIMGPMLSNFLVYRFDGEGNLLHRDILPMETPFSQADLSSRRTHLSTLLQAIESEAKGILDRFGVKESSVEVKIFFDDVESAGILDRPSEYTLFLEDPTEVCRDEEEAASIRESISEWDTSGKFVFVWGSELWLNKEGKLIAS